jgi:hypothetical protein
VHHDNNDPQIAPIDADYTLEGGENYLDLFRSNGTMYSDIGSELEEEKVNTV